MDLFSRLISPLALSLTLFTLLLLGQPSISSAEDTEQNDLVEKSRMTLNAFLADSNMSWLRDHMPNAKGIFIVPQLLKAAFLSGAKGAAAYFW